MRQLQTQEIKSVSGAGLLTGALTTGARAGVAAGSGLVQAGTIIGQPLASTTIRVLRFLI